MLKQVTNITITQNSQGRSKTLFFDFCHSWEFESNWEDLSSHGKIIFPKNIYVTDAATNKRFPLFGKNKNITDLFRKNDKIKVESFYIYWTKDLTELQTPKQTICTGWITNVKSMMPIEIEFEDDMYLLKRTPMQTQAFSKSKSIESILNEALAVTNQTFGTSLKVNLTSSTTITFDNSLLSTENETIAEFLTKLKKDANIKCYIRGNELRVGHIVYIEEEAQTKVFEFQNNIIDSDMDYRRKDDIILSAVASNHITETVGTTKKGRPKTKNRRIEVLVTFRNGSDTPTVTSVDKGEKATPNVDGERRTFTYPDAKTEKDLADRAIEDLKKYYYSGFKGKFTTFGTPFVQFGDNAQLINPALPDQNGTYKIKGVAYSGGVEGYRQVIELDYLILI